jgi:hypothetical protein
LDRSFARYGTRRPKDGLEGDAPATVDEAGTWQRSDATRPPLCGGNEAAGWIPGWLVGVVCACALTNIAFKVAVPTGALTLRALRACFTLRVVCYIPEGIGCIGDADGGDDGGGGDDDVFFHDVVGLVFGCILLAGEKNEPAKAPQSLKEGRF